MKLSKIKLNFIKNELRDLDIQKNTPVYEDILDRACAASDVLTKKELKILIEELVELYSARLY